MELFKDIKGYEGLYQVSNMGTVKSLNYAKTKKAKSLKLKKSNNGYVSVQLKHRGKMQSVHRLVAGHFIDNPDDKPQVNHLNGNKSDNRAINLEWCTQSENMIHAYRNGLQISKGLKGGLHPRAKIVIRTSMYGAEKRYPSTADVVKDGFNRKSVIRVCQGGRRKHKNYYWSYDV